MTLSYILVCTICIWVMLSHGPRLAWCPKVQPGCDKKLHSSIHSFIHSFIATGRYAWNLQNTQTHMHTHTKMTRTHNFSWGQKSLQHFSLAQTYLQCVPKRLPIPQHDRKGQLVWCMVKAFHLYTAIDQFAKIFNDSIIIGKTSFATFQLNFPVAY